MNRNIKEALRWLDQADADLKTAMELDRHYIGSRYPNFYPGGAPYTYYTKEIAQKCLSYAESILNEVKKYIKK